METDKLIEKLKIIFVPSIETNFFNSFLTGSVQNEIQHHLDFPLKLVHQIEPFLNN